MPSLTNYPARSFVKALYMGDSTVGKTGSLESLVRAGYKLRVLDFDNGLNILIQMIQHKATSQSEARARLEQVSYVPLQDKYKATSAGPAIVGIPKAFATSVQLLDKWEDGSIPQTWGPDHILVIDSLSAMGQAALAWAKSQPNSNPDERSYFFKAQQYIEHALSLLCSEHFSAHVIVCTHIRYSEDTLTKEVKGQANILGTALGPIIPRYFPVVIAAERIGRKRTIRTIPTNWLSLRTSAPFKVKSEYDISSGMAEIFKVLQEEVPNAQ